jgi:hypothetical protein
MQVYIDLMYLPLCPFRNYCSAAVYNFAVSTQNSVINSTIILSNKKSTTRVNLLFTCFNCAISIGCHSSCLIRFVGWFSFNINNHSYNRCGNLQKNTSCKYLNTYLARYLHGVYLGFLLYFCANLSSLVLNHTFNIHLRLIPWPEHSLLHFSFSVIFFNRSLPISHVLVQLTTKPFVGCLG